MVLDVYLDSGEVKVGELEVSFGEGYAYAKDKDEGITFSFDW